jgi:hypothetical protein
MKRSRGMEQCSKGFFELLRDMNKEDYMKNFLTYLIAPVIAGVKPSSTVTLTKGTNNLYEMWESKSKEYLEELQLSSIVLRKDDKASVILIYDEELLRKTLFEENNIRFLNKLGYYESNNLNDLLKVLVKRYDEFHCPHELGVFLGIPLEDVKAFINCSKEQCLMCGYWKVYGNKDTAEKIFSYYDKSKNIAKECILKRKDLLSVVYEIKEKFVLT